MINRAYIDFSEERPITKHLPSFDRWRKRCMDGRLHFPTSFCLSFPLHVLWCLWNRMGVPLRVFLSDVILLVDQALAGAGRRA